MNSPKRNLEQVISILNLAKISETDVVNESHVLRFAPEIATSKEVKLIEVTKDTLKYIQSGERYSFCSRLSISHSLLCVSL